MEQWGRISIIFMVDQNEFKNSDYLSKIAEAVASDVVELDAKEAWIETVSGWHRVYPPETSNAKGA